MVVGTTYLHISIIMCFTILLSIYNWNIDFIAENQNGNPISGMHAMHGRNKIRCGEEEFISAYLFSNGWS